MMKLSSISIFPSLLLLSTLPVFSQCASSNDENFNPLRRWLKDADAQRALRNAWGGSEHPLAAAYYAWHGSGSHTNVSSPCLQDIYTTVIPVTDWAGIFIDSSVKIPEGLFAAALTHLGNWDECVAVRDRTSWDPSVPLHGQMCLVGLTPYTINNNSERVRAIDLHDEAPFKRRGDGEIPETNVLILRLGVCLPSTCTASDVEEFFKPLIEHLPSVKGWKLGVQVKDIDCTTKEHPPLDTADWVAVGILIFLGIVVVLSTTYDLVTPSDTKRALPAAFSVISNGRKLLAPPRPGGDKTLSCLHGIRFLSMCWVVLGHRYYMQMTYPVINPSFFNDFISNVWRVGITNATLSVDTFFVLSGLLVAYLFFKRPPAARKLNIPLFYIHRYIRLTPALAMMVLLSASLVIRMGWGPAWPMYMTLARENCQKSWWNVLIYVNNYVRPDISCVGQSWYLMVDMQLHWLSPLVILPLARSPRIGMILLGILCVSGLIINFVISFVLNLPANNFAQTDVESLMSYFLDFYIPTYTRFVPYLEGFVLGYYLATKNNQNENKPRKQSFGMCIFSWLIVAIMLLAPLFLGYYFILPPFPSKTVASLYNCFSRSVWSLGVVGVVYLCSTGNGGPINSLLSWTGFQIFGRFSYSIYLVHMTVMSMEAASTHTNSFLSDGVILPAFASDLLVSLFCAAVLSLICESPFLVLEKELLGNVRPTAKDINPSSSNVKYIDSHDEKISQDKIV